MAHKRAQPTPDPDGDRRTRSELGILGDSQVASEDGNPAVVDSTVEWPLPELERAVRDSRSLASDAAEERDFHDALLSVQVAIADVAEADDPDAAQELVYLGVEIGRLLARIEVRPSRPLIETEKRRRKGAREGGRKRARQRAKSWESYQPMVDQLLRAGLSYSDAVEQAASSLGVNERTVRDHTTNPRPRNRGRWEKR